MYNYMIDCGTMMSVHVSKITSIGESNELEDNMNFLYLYIHVDNILDNQCINKFVLLELEKHRQHPFTHSIKIFI